jgi:hypothetical protein
MLLRNACELSPECTVLNIRILLLGSDLETDNETTLAARQHIFNKQEQTAAARERLIKRNVAAAMDTHTTEELLETVFSTQSVRGRIPPP